MKNSLVLVLLTLLILQCKHGPQKASMTTSTKEEVSKTGTASVQDTFITIDSIIKRNAIAIHKGFPWSSENPCDLENYNVQGVIPTLRDALVALSLEERLSNGFNPNEGRSNYHGVDYSTNGIDYSAAIDISVRCLTEDQIRYLLDELSIRLIAGWCRKKGEDGWNGDNPIHAVWVATPLKPQLRYQVGKWLSGKNGLTSDNVYKFWALKSEA